MTTEDQIDEDALNSICDEFEDSWKRGESASEVADDLQRWLEGDRPLASSKSIQAPVLWSFVTWCGILWLVSAFCSLGVDLKIPGTQTYLGVSLLWRSATITWGDYMGFEGEEPRLLTAWCEDASPQFHIREKWNQQFAFDPGVVRHLEQYDEANQWTSYPPLSALPEAIPSRRAFLLRIPPWFGIATVAIARLLTLLRRRLVGVRPGKSMPSLESKWLRVSDMLLVTAALVIACDLFKYGGVFTIANTYWLHHLTRAAAKTDPPLLTVHIYPPLLAVVSVSLLCFGIIGYAWLGRRLRPSAGPS